MIAYHFCSSRPREVLPFNPGIQLLLSMNLKYRVGGVAKRIVDDKNPEWLALNDLSHFNELFGLTGGT